MTATAGEPKGGGEGSQAVDSSQAAGGSQVGDGSQAGGGSQSVQAGRVGRAHGLDGSFYVTGARPRLLAVGTVMTVAGRETAIVRRAGTDEHPIVRVGGIESRSAAEAVRGTELTVDHANAPTLEDGEWWAGELEGCAVVDGDRLVGVVARLVELPSCEALEVRLGSPDAADGPRGGEPPSAQSRSGEPSSREILIPMVRDAIRNVDVASARIEVDMSFVEEA